VDEHAGEQGQSERSERRVRSEPGAGWLMGRLFGVPVFVAPSWLIVAAAITFMFGPDVAQTIPELGAGSYAVSFAYAVLLYLSVLIHELGHALVALRLGVPVRRITLQLLGGVTEMGGQARTPGREFLVAVAGPVLSLLLGAAALLALIGFGGSPADVFVAGGPSGPEGSAGVRVAVVLLGALTFANFVVGVFNLLPGLPLDGGVLLRSALWKLTGRPYTATIAAAWIGRGLAVLVFLAPFLLQLLTGDQPGLITLFWAVLLGGFIWLGATAAMRGAMVRERLPRLRARLLTRRAIPVTGDVPLAEALRQAGESGARGLVVVDHDGRPVGLVNEASVSATPMQRRPWVQVAALARRIEPGLVISAELVGEDLVQAMRATPATEYLVVDSEGAVFGVLAAADVERAFATT
jgi:Zn-dependent protease